VKHKPTPPNSFFFGLLVALIASALLWTIILSILLMLAR
jgi:hypothetical protein